MSIDMRLKFLLVITGVVFLSGCNTAMTKREDASVSQMNIWFTPEYAPASIAHHPFVQVPVRNNASRKGMQYAER